MHHLSFFKTRSVKLTELNNDVLTAKVFNQSNFEKYENVSRELNIEVDEMQVVLQQEYPQDEDLHQAFQNFEIVLNKKLNAISEFKSKNFQLQKAIFNLPKLMTQSHKVNLSLKQHSYLEQLLLNIIEMNFSSNHKDKENVFHSLKEHSKYDFPI